MNNSADFLSRILASKRSRSASQPALPDSRQHPVVPFCPDGGLICEIKRHSPSRGSIAEDLDPSAQAARYREEGAAAVSVLTEAEHFHGSLSDLVAVKRKFPDLAVLRKDFIVSAEDVVDSWKAGADAVLLIAAILDARELQSLAEEAESLGLAALLEAHTKEDLEKIRPLAPGYTGVNARDLRNFSVDLLRPLALAPLVDWPTVKVFESGVQSYAEATLARAAGYDALLVGEGAVRYPERIADMLRPFRSDLPRRGFWNEIAKKLDRGSGAASRPLVKICGITRLKDAERAVSLGADLIGFIFASSSRRADASVVRDCSKLAALKVAVVETDGGREAFPEEVKTLWKEGVLDAIQFHGAEPDSLCERYVPFFRAYNPSSVGDVDAIHDVRCPRVLIDAHVRGMKGGTGKRVEPDIVEAAHRRFPLWLAGGIDPSNVAAIVESHAPELVDISSGVEEAPGKKDEAKLKTLFSEIARVCDKRAADA